MTILDNSLLCGQAQLACHHGLVHTLPYGSHQRDRGECAEILTTACAVVCLVLLSLWLLLPLLIVKVCFSSVTGATVLRTQRQHVLWCALCFYLLGFFFQSNLPAVVQQ